MGQGKKSQASDAVRYGIGEWYGHLLTSLSPAKRNEFAEIGNGGFSGFPCPFRRPADLSALCKKKGGVCSIRKYVERADGHIEPDGGLVTLCPSRFWAGNKIFAEIGKAMLGTEIPNLVKEVPFLSSIVSADETSDDDPAKASETGDENGLGKPVGRIDTILVHPENPAKWCALEIQAVYFSGKGMGTHLAQYKAPAADLVFPDKVRRPDFRSSGPKRLMPQLQTKVPTLRRWGKKMAVVIDRPFLKSLGPLKAEPHLSNSDIVWFVVDYNTDTGQLNIVDRLPTTLENSVEALTAGIPLNLEDFEAVVNGLLNSQGKKARDKVIKLSDPQPSPTGGSELHGGAELPDTDDTITPGAGQGELSLGSGE